MVQVPGLAVSFSPSVAFPLTLGGVVNSGAPSELTACSAEEALRLPPSLLAVTV